MTRAWWRFIFRFGQSNKRQLTTFLDCDSTECPIFHDPEVLSVNCNQARDEIALLERTNLEWNLSIRNFEFSHFVTSSAQ